MASIGSKKAAPMESKPCEITIEQFKLTSVINLIGSVRVCLFPVYECAKESVSSRNRDASRSI